MLHLQPITKQKVIEHLMKNHTSEKKIDSFIKNCKVKLRYASDDKFTIIAAGDDVGIAKRCTYHKTADNFNESRGISIAIFRLGFTEIM